MSGALYMDAVITPPRSLSQRGFIVLICFITLANLASAAVFLSMGATFVPIFLGLDLLAVTGAFLLSFRAALRIERVQVSARDITVIHQTPRWSKVVWESPTAFTRVDVARDEERVTGVTLALSGRESPVAQALSPGERAEFARALQAAIREARSERS